MSFNWRSINWRSIDWEYLFRGKRAYITVVVAACIVTILTVVGVSKMVQNRRLENLYEQGQEALAQRNFEDAVEDFSKLYREDPKFKDVGKKLAEAVNGAATAKYVQVTGKDSKDRGGTTGSGNVSGPSSGSTSGDNTPPSTNGNTPPPSPATKKLIERLPRSLKGYETMGTQVNNDFASVERGFIPYDRSKISNLLVTVMDRATAEGAQAFIDGTSKKLFPEGGKTITVRGKQAYFGADTRSINAVLVWAEGNIVYELIMQSTTQQPKTLEKPLIEAADQF